MVSRSVTRLSEHFIELRSLPSDLDPATVLLTEMARAEAAVEFLDAIIMTFTGKALTELPEVVETPNNDKWAVAYHIPLEIWKLWMDSRKMLASTSATVVKLGLEERRLAQQDERARQMYMTVQTLLADPTVGLDARQRRAVGALIAEKLRAEVLIEQAIEAASYTAPLVERGSDPEPEFVGLQLVTYEEDEDNPL